MNGLDLKLRKEKQKFNRKQEKNQKTAKIKDNQVHKLARFFDECKEDI